MKSGSIKKDFTLTCPYEECPQKVFTKNLTLQQEENEKYADVSVECPYCGNNAIYSLPESYIPEKEMIREVKGARI